MQPERLRELISPLKGKIGFYYENMIDGDKLSYNADHVFSEGKLSWDQKVIVREGDKKPSCGALLSLSGDIEVDIESLCRLMITLSDNTATNMLIRTVGIDELKRGFAQMGLVKTQIQRELFDDEAAAKGLENYISPEEIAMLLKQVYQRGFVSRQVSEKIENVMLLQQIRHKIPGYIGRKKKIANKTGEDSDTTHDAAIVFAQRPFVLVITSNDTDVPQTERFIREAALELYRENGEGE